MKYSKKILSVALIISLLAFPVTAFAAGGGCGSKAATAATLTTVKDVNVVEASVAELQQAASTSSYSEDTPEYEKLRKKVLDMLKEINAQADKIEAQVASFETDYDSPEMGDKIDRLKDYVANLRTKAQEAAQPFM